MPSTEGQQPADPPNEGQAAQNDQVQKPSNSSGQQASQGRSDLKNFLMQRMPTSGQKLVQQISGYTFEQNQADSAKNKKELANGKEYLQYFQNKHSDKQLD